MHFCISVSAKRQMGLDASETRDAMACMRNIKVSVISILKICSLHLAIICFRFFFQHKFIEKI